MKNQFLSCLLTAVILTGCGTQQTTEQASDSFPNVQEVAQLQPYEVLSPLSAETEEIRACWLPVMLYSTWMRGKSAEEFRTQVCSAFQNCAELGINTVYLHVRAYGDAYYLSDLFPKGSYLDGDYDPLAIMTEEAHAVGLSVHAWINPLRGPTEQVLADTDVCYPLRQWYDDPQYLGTYLVAVDGRYYLNPAYPEVRQLIADGVTEILTQYPVDGIHIDDYFYPTTDESFDATAFAESGAADLGDWRRENCSAMVRAIYDAVKAQGDTLIFSISPQGNLSAGYENLYADAALWCSTAGYCDYIVPQLYYGFENSTCPFAETAALWAQTATEAKLVLGIGVYKTGLSDTWAGSGVSEWLTDGTVASREVALAASLDGVDGVALYSYASLFEPEESVAAAITAEVERIGTLWRTE
jgi:uncharacterized lipoprotein YddW (UPF0748 family)